MLARRAAPSLPIAFHASTSSRNRDRSGCEVSAARSTAREPECFQVERLQPRQVRRGEQVLGPPRADAGSPVPLVAGGDLHPRQRREREPLLGVLEECVRGHFQRLNEAAFERRLLRERHERRQPRGLVALEQLGAAVEQHAPAPLVVVGSRAACGPVRSDADELAAVRLTVLGRASRRTPAARCRRRAARGSRRGMTVRRSSCVKSRSGFPYYNRVRAMIHAT